MTIRGTKGRCCWCGVFIAKNTEPVFGVNALGEGLHQYVCPEHKIDWLSLSKRNKEALAK